MSKLQTSRFVIFAIGFVWRITNLRRLYVIKLVEEITYLIKKFNECCNVDSIHCDKSYPLQITPQSLITGPLDESTRLFIIFLIEFDRGMVEKGVVVCCTTSSRKWSIRVVHR